MEPDIFNKRIDVAFSEDQILKENVLKTTKIKCSICKIGDIRADGKPTPMIVYGREGVQVLPHQYMRCNYRVGTGDRKVSCRAGHGYGYVTYKGTRIYDDDALKNQFLVVSNQTAFSIDYLVEVVGQVNISSGKFEAMAKQYNRFHLMKLPFDVLDRRVELNTDLLNDAYFLFCYLEIAQRRGIKNYQVIKNTLDSTILEHRGELMKAYRQHWTIEHECDIPGCRSCIVIDAGLKPHRKVCKALWNGVREFQDAGQSVVTGCTTYPVPNSTYCTLHEGEPTPVADNISSRTRKILKNYREQTKESDQAGDDHIFIIESILDIEEHVDGGRMFKVKWFNFPVEAATVEPESSIPKFIIEYYGDETKLGKPLPSPRIKHTKKTTSGTLFHFLTWEGEKGGKWHGEDFFKLAGGYGEDSLLVPELSCRTRKSRDKRICRWNVGIFLGAFPCGVVPLWDELFGSESTSQVYGVFIEYLSQLPDEEREKLKDLIYDDNCHMAKFALNNVKNEVTNFFANVRKTIDKFHFVNHIDQWCIEHCDPYKVKDLDNVNTEICEQLFRKVNSHSNCKSMNESRYFLFWLYNLDLHNLDIEDLVSVSDPRTEYRWMKINIHEVELETVKKMNLPDVIEKIDQIDEIGKKLQDVQLETPETFVCNDCGGGFKSKGFLDHHREKKHGEILKPLMCEECNKILQSKRNLEEHITKIHRTCKICKLKFKNKEESEEHCRSHTTCSVCKVDMKTKYKMDRHMKTHM
jgi:hypothetical protein